MLAANQIQVSPIHPKERERKVFLRILEQWNAGPNHS